MSEAFNDEANWERFEEYQGYSKAFVSRVHAKRRQEARAAQQRAKRAEVEKIAAAKKAAPIASPEPVRVHSEIALPRVKSVELMRSRGAPAWAIEIVLSVAEKHQVLAADIVGRSLVRKVVAARHEAMYRVKAAKPKTSFPTIGKWFGRDHTSALFAVASYQAATGLPSLTTYDVSLTRRRNAAQRSAERKRAKERQ